MRIGVDIDNVIALSDEAILKEFLKHDKEIYEGKGIINEDAPYITIGMFSWPQEEVNNYYIEAINKVVRDIEVVDEVVDSLKELRKRGHEIYIISGRDNKMLPDPYGITKEWLQRNKIEYDKLILTDTVDSSIKAKMCLENDIDIMIDDSVKMLLEVEKAGIKTLLYNTKYNAKIENDLTRIYSWKEIVDYIISYKQ